MNTSLVCVVATRTKAVSVCADFALPIFDQFVMNVIRVAALFTGGWLVPAALLNCKTACSAPGSCLRMPRPAGHQGLS